MAQQLSPKFFSFTDDNHAIPSRTRHNGDTGADVQQGPAQRFLFRLRPLRKPFFLSLVVHILRILNTTEKDADVIGMWPRQDIAHTWTLGVYY